jgi:hypothetical protein
MTANYTPGNHKPTSCPLLIPGDSTAQTKVKFAFLMLSWGRAMSLQVCLEMEALASSFSLVEPHPAGSGAGRERVLGPTRGTKCPSSLLLPTRRPEMRALDGL